MDRLRIGTLGAARITPGALIKPARGMLEVAVTAVAARDRDCARRFAARHGIAVVHDSYEALIADPAIDAIYNPLPNSLHAPWTLRAIAAGKHVLCEKPFASNEAEAAQVAAAAVGLVVMEAFHYRYHPLARRMSQVAGGRDGEPAGTAARPRRADRSVGQGKTARRAVDGAMAADFRFPAGATGRIRASLWSGQVIRVGARAVGEKGEMRVLNFIALQFYNRLTVRAAGRTRREHVGGQASYTYQLRAFAAAVLRGEPVLTTPEDAVANMRQIDAVYRAAGLPPRGTL
jgi:predicted dehydrogenase